MESNVLSQITKAVQKTGDSALIQMTEAADKKLKEPFFPKVVIISDGTNIYGKKEIIDVICACIAGQAEILGDYIGIGQLGERTKFCLCMKYGAGAVSEEVFTIGEQQYYKVDAAFEEDFLKKADVAWVCGFDSADIDASVIEDADVVLLLTNAVMALSQQEKEWLRKNVPVSFYGRQVIVSLYGKHYLNTAKDFEIVCQNTEAVLKGFDANIRFCPELLSAWKTAESLLTSETAVLETLHKKAVVEHYLTHAKRRVEELVKLSDMDAGRLKATAEKLEDERKNVEMSGRMMMESTLENMYRNLLVQIVSAADKYSGEAYESIRAHIQAADNVEQEVAAIQPYLEAVWKHFECEISARFAQKQDEISWELERQMEQDCQNVADVMKLEAGVELFGQLGYPLPDAAYMPDDEEDRKRRSKMISKGLMIASIALAFVNPVWGLAAFAGTQFFQRSRNEHSEQLRQRILGGLFQECNTVKEQVIARITQVIEETKERSKQNICKVYSDVMDNLMKSVMDSIEQINVMKEQQEQLRRIADEEIPDVRKHLQ